jgi:hypothetical protein
MTTPTPGGGNQNIVINIVANVKNFLSGFNNALSTAGKAATAFVNNIQGKLNPALQQTQQIQNNVAKTSFNLYSTFLNSAKQINILTNSTLGWKEAIRTMPVLLDKTGNALLLMRDLASQYGISMQKAGQMAIATGQAELNAVNAALMVENKRTLSINEVNSALSRLGENIRRVARGEKVLFEEVKKTNSGLNEQGKQGNKTGGVLEWLGKRIGAIVSSLAIAGSAYQFIDFLKELAKEGTAIAQSQFNFTASVKASQIAFGAAAQSMEFWENRVKELRKELGIFSERDIRDAITQTINLTRNLDLGADSIEKILQVAVVLSKTAGVDLNQAISDVTHAMTGSRVVLDKYGLNIRDGDLKARALAMGITEATESMTSQEIAIITLNEVLSQANDLITATGDYQGNLAGQVRTTNAIISDQKDSISTTLDELNLYFKNLYNEFIVYVAGVADRLKPLMGFIEQVNDAITKQQQYDAAGISTIPSFKDHKLGLSNEAFLDFGLTTPLPVIAAKVNEAILQDMNNIHKYLVGTTDNLVAYANAVGVYIRVTKEFDEAHRDRANPGGDGMSPGHRTTPSDQGLDENTQNKFEEYGERFHDIFLQQGYDLAEAGIKYRQAVRDTFTDAQRDIEDAIEEFNEAIGKLDRDRDNSLADALTEYTRGLEDIQNDESNDTADAERERDQKKLDNKEKYYDALRALDREYYFSLFDAVAANDAVAIKQAERKYNLDKANLQDKLDNENKQEDDSYEERIRKIRQETEQRRAELQLRYQREREDILKEYARDKKELEIKLTQERNEIMEHYEELRDDLELKYAREKEIINRETNKRLAELQDDLQDELGEYEDHVEALLEVWREYYKDWLKDHDDFVKDARIDPPANCPKGYEWDGVARKCVPIVDPGGAGLTAVTNTPQASLNNTSNHVVMLTSDGSVGDDVIESVAKELADIYEGIIITNGGTVKSV